MKRIALFVCVLMFVACNAYGWPSPIRVLEDTKVLKSGGSVFVVDLTKPEFQDADIFNLQLQTATPYYGGTGATIPIFRWAVSNHVPSGVLETNVGKNAFTAANITEAIEWTPIIPGTIVHTSGMSRYVWTFEVDPGRFMLLKADNSGGITDFKLTADMGISKHGQRAKAIHLGTLTFGPLAIAGTSLFSSGDTAGVAVPEGARYAIIKSADSGNSLWMTRRTAVDRDKDPALQAGDVFPVEGSYSELKRIGVGAAVINVKAIVDFYTRKPF